MYVTLGYSVTLGYVTLGYENKNIILNDYCLLFCRNYVKIQNKYYKTLINSVG